MSHQLREVSATTLKSPYITKNLNGYSYYICSQCFFISLNRNTIKQHVDRDNSLINCHSKSTLQCFGCANIFFSKQSLLSHAIHDHQMTESSATTLINRSNFHSEKDNDSPEKSGMNKQTRKIRILSDIRIPPNSVLKPLKPGACETITGAILEDRGNRRLDISIPLEQEIINDLNEYENASESDHDDYELPDLPINCGKKKISRKKKEIKVMGFKCETEGCNVRLLAEENLLYHKKCHNSDGKEESEAFRCPECQEFFSNRWNIMAGHLWRLHLVDMELHTCELCNYKTPSLSKLINQHRGIHGNERPFVCDFCGKGFKTSKQLRTHKISHKSNDKNSFKCEKCQRIFKTCRLLKLHNNSVHKDCKPFTCNFCEYSAATRSGLKLHLRRHTGEKPFSCDQCAYSTGDHNSIRRHKLRHLGLKPYNCPHCSYACIQSSTYKVHLRSKHPGLDDGIMFSCQFCSYRTLKQEKLLTHITKHTESSGDYTKNDKD